MCEGIARYRRFTGWDYAKGASLFITISTEPRRVVFGRVDGDKVALTALGAIVRDALESIPHLNPGISLFGHVVMPDHIHFNINIAPGMEQPLASLGNAIRRFKNHTTKQAKLLGLAGLSPAIASVDGRAALGLLWQQCYHDRLCLSRRTIDATERYIAYNPLKWTLMHGASAKLRIREPLSSPRLDINDYWKGVGNTTLLDPGNNIVSLRVSRKVRDIDAVLRRMESAVAKSWVVLSGFISPGERAVFQMLCRRKDARFIRIRPSCIPNARYKPDSALAAPFDEGRFLEIAKGNDEIDFDRNACLGINAEIAEIAASTNGIALYFTEHGLKVLKRS